MSALNVTFRPARGTVYKTSHCAQPFPANYTLNYGKHVP